MAASCAVRSIRASTVGRQGAGTAANLRAAAHGPDLTAAAGAFAALCGAALLSRSSCIRRGWQEPREDMRDDRDGCRRRSTPMSAPRCGRCGTRRAVEARAYLLTVARAITHLLGAADGASPPHLMPGTASSDAHPRTAGQRVWPGLLFSRCVRFAAGGRGASLCL